MKIEYRKEEEYIPVDVAAMRPKDSYRKTVERRNYPVERLIHEHGRIPDDFLHTRPCPTCGSEARATEMEKEGLTFEDNGHFYVSRKVCEEHE